VKFPIACVLDALFEAKVGPRGKSVSLETLPFLIPRRLFPSSEANRNFRQKFLKLRAVHTSSLPNIALWPFRLCSS
jgi:hypothetical protein